MDIHSYARPDLVLVRHLDLEFDISFDRHVVEGRAVLDVERRGGDELILDTRGLTIYSVEDCAGFELGQTDPVLGTPLSIRLLPGHDRLKIHYATAPDASALQWLAPAQTAGKRRPFLYTQSQAIHARSWIPVQDSPAVRITFTARVRVPEGLRVLMGAAHENGVFRMEQPVPSYLIALAVGDLEFRPLGPRCGVWAEPELAARAAAEFADTESMMRAVEEMFGPYRWGRYDLLVLPPSFPFGGMENPRLTFTTPTILAGDKSLVALVAHELAHSWSGNLVTNATWSDFWLNEGFTVYLERRILERIYGRERAEMEAALGRAELERTMAELPESDRVLHIDLAGRDPDDGCTLVPYEKGALLLRTIEQAVGREPFDRFLSAYFDRFAFSSITTAEFLDYLRRELPTPVPLEEWIFRPGIPAGAAEAGSEVFDRVAGRWPDDTSLWSTHEWLHFLRSLERPDLARLDREFHLNDSANSEILFQWLSMAVEADYRPAYGKLEEFLCAVGRRKFLKPLYLELVKTVEGRARAQRIYAKARPSYHPIAQATIDGIVDASA
jgi:aminopeptidase N